MTSRPLLTFLLAAGIVVSGALNAHLLLRRLGGASAASDLRACEEVEPPARAELTGYLAPGRAAVRISGCQVALAANTARLEALRAEIVANRSWRAVFEEGTPQPDRTEQLSKLIRETVKVAGQTPSFSLECRSDVCRIEPGASLTSLLGAQSWFRQVSIDEFMVGVGGDDAFFRLRATPRPDGHAFLTALIGEFRSSGAQQRCGNQHPDADGALHVLLTVRARAGAPPALEAFFGGQLADTPAGKCLVAELDRMLERPNLPEELSDASVQALVTTERPRVQ